jgi:cytochrome c-type biogenesis protein CcmH
MVSPAVLYAVIVLAAILLAAAVAWPLRRGSPRLFVAVLVALPVMALSLYRIVGTPQALDPDAVQVAEAGMPSMEEAVAELEATLERDPAQPEGWRLLARAQAALGNRERARDAYLSALQHIPDDPDLLVEAAQAVAQAHPDHLFDAQALGLLQQALAHDPDNQRARWFIGVAHRQRGEDAQAAAVWEELLPVVDAATANALRQQIALARDAAGLPPLPAQDAGQATTGQSAAPAEGLRVRVRLDEDFAARARLDGDAVVFVVARAAGGPPMPVAVERHAVRDLPLDVVLDDGDSPMPTVKLSTLQEVELVARISATGSANRSEGDLESAPVRVRVPADAPVELVIGAPDR